MVSMSKLLAALLGITAVPAALPLPASSQTYVDPRGNRLCGGTTMAGFTDWAPYREDGMVLGLDARVDASACDFGGRAPRYFVSLVGDDAGAGAGAAPAATVHTRDIGARGFRVYVHHPSLRQEPFLARARRRWRLSWLGAAGAATGVALRWRPFGNHSLYVDVDTSAAVRDAAGGIGAPPPPPAGARPAAAVADGGGGSATAATAATPPPPPRFLASLCARGRFRVLGAHAVYRVRPAGFRVYVLLEVRDASRVTPERGRAWGWELHWAAVSANAPWAGGGGGGARGARGAWRMERGGGGSGAQAPALPSGLIAAQLRVDTGASHFESLRAYSAVLASASDIGWDGAASPALRTPRAHEWTVGGASLHNPTAGGFGVAVQAPATAAADFDDTASATGLRWYVSWVGFEAPAVCAVSAWGAWGACSASCGRRARRMARRRVLRRGNDFGKPCPALARSEPCARGTAPAAERARHCPLDCVVAPWGGWPSCPVVCGGGVTRRSRVVLADMSTGTVGAAYGGAACPALAQHRVCNTAPCAGHGLTSMCGGTALPRVEAPAPHAADGSDGANASVAVPGVWRLHSGSLAPLGHAGIVIDVDASACAVGMSVGEQALDDAGGRAPVFVASVQLGGGGDAVAQTRVNRAFALLHRRPTRHAGDNRSFAGYRRRLLSDLDGGGLGAALAAIDALTSAGSGGGEGDSAAGSSGAGDRGGDDTGAMPLGSVPPIPMPTALQMLVATAVSPSPAAGQQGDALYFRVHAWQRGVAAEQTLALARRFGWAVSWVGERGRHAGVTTPGRAGWRSCVEPACEKARALGLHTLQLDVDTTMSRFGAEVGAPPPLYVASLHLQHPRTAGRSGGSGLDDSAVQRFPRPHCAHNIARPSATGFRLYATFEHPLLATAAEDEGWAVAWIGISDGQQRRQQTAADGVWSGESKMWASAGVGADGAIATHADVFSGGFTGTPSFVSTVVVGADAPGTMVAPGDVFEKSLLGSGFAAGALSFVGGGVVLDPSPLGFRALLRPLPEYAALLAQEQSVVANVALARGGRWRVQFVAFLRVDCAMAPWGAWTACGASCLGGGARRRQQPPAPPPLPPPQSRVRTVLHDSFGGGKACHVSRRVQTRVCQLPRCDVGCIVGAWGAWGRCDARCGFAGSRHRARSVLVAAVGGGQVCPPLSATRDCRRAPCGRNTDVAATAAAAAAAFSGAAAVDARKSRARFEAGATAQVILDLRVRGPAALQLADSRTAANALRELGAALARIFGVRPPSLVISRAGGRLRVRILAQSMVAASAVAARATGADAATLLGSDLMALVAPPRTLPYLGAEARARQARQARQRQRSQRQREQKERSADERRVAGVAGAAALAAAAFFAWRASSATVAAQRHLRSVPTHGVNSRAEAVPLRRPVVQAGGEGAPALSALQAALAAGVEAAARREFQRHEDEISLGL